MLIEKEPKNLIELHSLLQIQRKQFDLVVVVYETSNIHLKAI